MKNIIWVLAMTILLGALASTGFSTESKAQKQKQKASAPAPAAEKPAAKQVDKAIAGPLVGKWHNNKKGAIFPKVELKKDGTGTFINYAGKESEGVWTVEDGYLEFQAGGEKAGSAYKVGKKEIDMGYVGKYTRIE